jgi:hypothetical protein
VQFFSYIFDDNTFKNNDDQWCHRDGPIDWFLIAARKRRDEVFPFNGPRKEFESTKGVIRIRKSKKERQYNGQKKKNKRTNNDVQNTT